VNVDQRIAATCPARTVCKQHNVLCSTACPWFIDIRYHTELAGISKRNSKFTIDTLPEGTLGLGNLRRYGETITDRVAAGQGVYFHGGVGSGKTTAACAIAMSFIIAKSLENIRTGANNVSQLVQFAQTADLLETIRAGFSDDDARQHADALVERLKTVPLAIIDDIGAEKPSEFTRERLLQIIGARYDNELCTIFTSNLSPTDLREPLGDRIQSRIAGMTVEFKYNGPDRRKTL
jgi:DNA replication protein DnaC